MKFLILVGYYFTDDSFGYSHKSITKANTQSKHHCHGKSGRKALKLKIKITPI